MTVVVVGAGPAGLHAALAAANAGADVVVVDGATEVGGQFHRRPAGEAGPPVARRVLDHPRITVLGDTSVWSVQPGRRLHLVSGPADSPGAKMSTVDASALVLATGAHDRVLPFPGWELPGVLTAGAAQTLAKTQRLAPGRRVLVAGTGPFLLPVAAALLDVGADVPAVLDATGPIAVARGWVTHPATLLRGANLVGQLAGHATILARHRVRYRPRTAVVAAHGDSRLTAVTTARLDADWRELPGTRREIAVDALAVGVGFTPRTELAVAAGCRLDGEFVVVTAAQVTSVPGVFAAGEITGIAGARTAAAEGTLAGLAAAAWVGRPISRRRRAAALRRVRHARGHAAALAAAWPVRPGWHGWVTPETVLCRCEEVDHAALAAAVRDRDVTGVRSLKLSCRIGLGRCQGRLCGTNAIELADALRAELGQPPLTDRAALAGRPIATPVRLGDLAALHQPPERSSP